MILTITDMISSMILFIIYEPYTRALKMANDDNGFEDEVRHYLNKNGKMRREQLINALMEAHTQTNKKGHTSIEGGYSKITINRALKKMIASDKLRSLDYKEMKQYGFQETDKRSKYLFTPEGLNLKNHIDKVLKILIIGDEIDKQMALKEINRYEKLYSFDESQLDLIVKNLTSANAELTNQFLITLIKNIINKGTEPEDKNALLTALKEVLNKYSEPTGKNKVIRNTTIRLLSHYKDEAIIDQLIKDATTLDNPLEVEEDYDPSSIAEIIINNPSILFDTERQLKREGKHDSAQFISNIRTKAMISLGMSNVPHRNDGIEGADF